MFVLGIDPGLTRCGYGLVEGSFEGIESFRALRAGIIETDPGHTVEQRLSELFQELSRLVDEVQPDAVVVEKVFFMKNARTAIPVAQASGIAVGIAGSRGITVRQFTSQEMKLAVTGYGAASKEQIQGMVASLCNLSQAPKPADAADALALAICYFVNARMESKYPKGASA
jgi:crossover junction endodeoxyribonuclease RuvC